MVLSLVRETKTAATEKRPQASRPRRDRDETLGTSRDCLETETETTSLVAANLQSVFQPINIYL
jgi:hypothetical protein